MCIASAQQQQAENHPGLHPVITEEEEEDTMVVDTTSKRRASRRRNSASSASSASAKRTRTYVEHNYTDHYNDPIYVPGETEEEEIDAPKRRGPRGGVVVPFPERLYTMLKQADVEGFEDVVSFANHGRCFTVHQPKRFVEEVMPKFFRQSKLTSFQRQVNLYGFRRLTAGQDRGAYYHELFLRGRPDLHKKLVRIRVKGTGFKSASSPATEPNFYAYPRCTEEGPKDFRTENSTMETEMPCIVSSAAELIPSATFSAPMPPLQAPVHPSWKPLSAPPKMMVVSPHMKAIDGPTGDIQELEKSNESQNKKGSHNGQMTLSSMARSIALASNEPEEESCPVTPAFNVRHMLSSGLEEALALVSPVDSPVPSAHPSMLSLDDCIMEFPASIQAPPLLPPPPQESVDNRMGSFQEGVQALLSGDLKDFDVDHALMVENSDLTNEYALDPLFMLDDVVGATA